MGKKLITFGIIIISLLVIGFFFFQHVGVEAEQYIGDFEFNLDELKNGDYSGSYKVCGIKTAAEITYSKQDSTVENVVIKSLLTTPGYYILEKISEKIQNNESLKFDAISGATISSNFLKAAIKNSITDTSYID